MAPLSAPIPGREGGRDEFDTSSNETGQSLGRGTRRSAVAQDYIQGSPQFTRNLKSRY
jgi:hypothetical protein